MNNTPQDSSLGREVAYPAHYDPTLLFPIPRQGARDEIGIAADALPFVGHDRWHAYELSWLDARGKPRVATATAAWFAATTGRRPTTFPTTLTASSIACGDRCA